MAPVITECQQPSSRPSDDAVGNLQPELTHRLNLG